MDDDNNNGINIKRVLRDEKSEKVGERDQCRKIM